MKRAIHVLFICIALLLCLPLQVFAAIVFDGNVIPSEWFDYPAKELSPKPAQCGITAASVRVAVQPTQSRVMFGFTIIAPGVEADSPVGAAFVLGEQEAEIGRWQQGLGASFDATNYSLQGMAYIPENVNNGYYTFEIALGYKNEAALAALKDLSVQLYGPGPEGIPSWPLPCPVVTAEPVTTTKAPTTEKATTTKAPTTEKPTTTKEPTTEKATTTKAPTTEKATTTKEPTTEKPTTTKEPTTEKPTTTAKPTTTLPVYTTAPQVFSYTPAPLTTAYLAPAAPQAAATARVTTQQAQPGTSRTEIFYYTVVYTDAPGAAVYTGAPGTTAAAWETLWTYAPAPTEAPPQSVPTLALPAPQPTRTASPSAALLFSAGGILVLLAAVLIVFWARAQKKPDEPGNPT